MGEVVIAIPRRVYTGQRILEHGLEEEEEEKRIFISSIKIKNGHQIEQREEELTVKNNERATLPRRQLG
jgi:hypothetical protein